ncbi:hypothetical protein CONLIGDRAFT_650657 [Coniochaeta ligniaria NRRL 30616]|uniref:Uncharacterized protein n=1 Tax=Coniochaeta ligniaria NRRL 30616 TaxID=1408157 RepID=A0A1J7I4L2_9PEZI|nr:hypothetical protein CONLIGDRAFT_650657 [Coniochaeta ligniaria NRRL 30616]
MPGVLLRESRLHPGTNAVPDEAKWAHMSTGPAEQRSEVVVKIKISKGSNLAEHKLALDVANPIADTAYEPFLIRPRHLATHEHLAPSYKDAAQIAVVIVIDGMVKADRQYSGTLPIIYALENSGRTTVSVDPTLSLFVTHYNQPSSTLARPSRLSLRVFWATLPSLSVSLCIRASYWISLTNTYVWRDIIT